MQLARWLVGSRAEFPLCLATTVEMQSRVSRDWWSYRSSGGRRHCPLRPLLLDGTWLQFIYVRNSARAGLANDYPGVYVGGSPRLLLPGPLPQVASVIFGVKRHQAPTGRLRESSSIGSDRGVSPLSRTVTFLYPIRPCQFDLKRHFPARYAGLLLFLSSSASLAFLCRLQS